MSNWHAYWRLMRGDRPIGFFLLLWPTLWALFLAANGMPPLPVLVIFIIGVWMMRAAGCVINDVFDRNMDGQVRRTCLRPLACGELSVRAALVCFAVLCVLAFALVLVLNPLTIVLAVVGFLWATSYPLAKRYFALPQLVLAVAFAWGVPMAYAAVTAAIPAEAWLLLSGVACWIFAYDTAYAMTDRADDIRVGIHSSAIFFGYLDRVVIGVLQAFLLLSLAIIGQMRSLGAIFWLALLLAALLFVYQQCLLFKRRPNDCFRAFLNNHWVGTVIFIGIICSLSG